MRHNQNRRSRGRNRKGPNPLTRSYESNGPDVKVRGTAAHVAEKYMSLARDAQSAGDTVSAENYLQHAEHYNRIVMAAQGQFQQSQPQFREGSDEAYDDRQANGRGRDRFDSDGDGRSDGGSESYEGGDDRAYRSERRHDDQERQQGSPQNRYEARSESQERDLAAEPQPDVIEPAASAAVEDEAPSQTRRRRGRPSKKASEGKGAEAPDSDEDSTKDGAAALAAFPE